MDHSFADHCAAADANWRQASKHAIGAAAEAALAWRRSVEATVHASEAVAGRRIAAANAWRRIAAIEAVEAANAWRLAAKEASKAAAIYRAIDTNGIDQEEPCEYGS